MTDKPLSHLNESGEVHMVDVSAKAVTARSATAEATVLMSQELVDLFFQGDLPKGDAAAVARIAGVMASKKTADLIPLCHPISITGAEIGLEPTGHGIRVLATVRTNNVTGVEMEALTAASVSALTIYDMVKSVEKGVEISNLRLLRKSGGRSGEWVRG